MTLAEPTLHIRKGMDVYSAYQDQYIGSVVGVAYETSRLSSDAERQHLADAMDQGEDAIQTAPAVAHEEDSAVQPTATAGKRLLGESMGPFPTGAVGNHGPINQSAAHAYAIGRSDSLAGVRWFAVRPGRINWGLFTPPVYIPTNAVHSVSMERIVIDIQKENIPQGWKERPS